VRPLRTATFTLGLVGSAIAALVELEEHETHRHDPTALFLVTDCGYHLESARAALESWREHERERRFVDEIEAALHPNVAEMERERYG
jgi:hypothetical protein